MFKKFKTAVLEAFAPQLLSALDAAENGLRYGNTAPLQGYLKAGGDPNASSGNHVNASGGRPLVIWAGIFNNKLAVKLLLNAGASADSFDPYDGQSLLHFAALWNDLELVQELLLGGADPDAHGRYGGTPLFVAATRGNAEVARALLDAGADPNRPNWAGVAPLEALGVFPQGESCGTPALREKQR